ncbi:helix-turn-helix transcriptional regulator [Microbulbifer halophilus]|uniref:Helix-turn-helix transcriptional regulator n=1 Tax=Microbulbifer halophilus TaxID=453963 RepID=A0ABW5ED09_9GAMM|nr:AraC family transcriptional regulator [Microbulbifer halophilus]MCW8127109.1 AraC family transcriptional regulator [Microbulbifer halophilus]
MDILPNALFRRADIKTLLRRENAAVLYKRLDQNLIDKAIFLTLPAILYVKNGAITCRNDDGSYAEADAGELVCLPKDLYAVSDYVSAPETDNGEFSALLFFFDAGIIERNLQSLPKPGVRSNQPCTHSANQTIRTYMEAINAVYANGVHSAALLDAKLQELLHLLLLEESTAEFLTPLHTALTTGGKRDIMGFMQRNYTLDLRTKDFAELCGRSESSFQRQFKAIFGTPVNQWLIEKRLTEANRLLREHDYSVTDVALQVGYRNVSHFIQAYRRYFNHTPRQAQLTE